ncbi:MAG: hypothetical protein M3O50_11070 [Myxococcota bacterium]|nr:hypothetical protein [Myxococcota bacterium]
METNSIPAFRPDVVGIQTAQRPTPTPVRVRFSEVLAGGARALVQGAQTAVSAIPGSPLLAVALRGGAAAAVETGVASVFHPGGSRVLATGTTPEGPSAAASVTSALSTPATPAADGGLESSLAQSQAMNLYYLQIQEEVNAQSRTFTALSNVLEVEHNTAKSAIGNIH